MFLDNAKAEAGIRFDLLLQIFSELLVSFGGNDGQGVGFEPPHALAFLVDAQAQAAADGLAAFTFAAHFPQGTNLKNVRIVPSFAQG